MGRRSEQRIAVSLPVTVRGVDANGNPFEVRTETHDISFSGASLEGLQDVVTPGAKIELESHGRKAWYRVRWVGRDDSTRSGRIGIHSLEHGRYIWGVAPKGWEPDTYQPPVPAEKEASFSTVSAAFSSWSGPERRQFARHPCRIDARVKVDDGSVSLPGKIEDISLGGCYVEMLAPLPAETIVRISFKLDSEELEPRGRVCSSQIGAGMGIEFTSLKPDEFEALRKFAPPMVPPNNPAPHLPATSSEALDAIVRLLIHKGVFTSRELTDELEKVKNRRIVVPV
ncbi:MAG TPA: PilZ domain-containing protein [Candidatus Acidoferrales bacterium]|nr:PilZ domain-containing protein [Candidatus Acidoferrales bacterium]